MKGGPLQSIPQYRYSSGNRRRERKRKREMKKKENNVVGVAEGGRCEQRDGVCERQTGKGEEHQMLSSS